MNCQIPIKSLLLHIAKVLDACDLTSVTVSKIKQYLKHRFKDRLPCDNDLDIILNRIINGIRFNPPSFVPLQKFNNKNQQFEPSEENERYESQNKPDYDRKQIPNKKRVFRVCCYLLKKGSNIGPATYSAQANTIKDPHTSKIVRIITPGNKGQNVAVDRERRPVLQDIQKTRSKESSVESEKVFVEVLNLEKEDRKVSEAYNKTTKCCKEVKENFKKDFSCYEGSDDTAIEVTQGNYTIKKTGNPFKFTFQKTLSENVKKAQKTKKGDSKNMVLSCDEVKYFIIDTGNPLKITLRKISAPMKNVPMRKPQNQKEVNVHRSKEISASKPRTRGQIKKKLKEQFTQLTDKQIDAVIQTSVDFDDAFIKCTGLIVPDLLEGHRKD